MVLRAVVVALALALTIPGAAAQPEATPPPPAPAPPDGEDARYSFHRVQEGYLRLDVRTGQVALCSRRQVGWACQVVPDDRTVLEQEIARLQAENGVLKRQLLSRGVPLPDGVAQPPAQKDKTPPRGPADSNLERVLNAMTAMWQRLVDMIAALQRDLMKDG